MKKSNLYMTQNAAKLSVHAFREKVLYLKLMWQSREFAKGKKHVLSDAFICTHVKKKTLKYTNVNAPVYKRCCVAGLIIVHQNVHLSRKICTVPTFLGWGRSKDY